MIITIISLISLSIGLSIILTWTPLTLGIWIIILALSISILISSIISTWFSLIIFLIYIGGILVIFAYFVAIQPNQQLYIIIPFFIILITICIIPIYRQKTLITNIYTNNWWVRRIFELINIPSLTLLALVLFLALITVVKITYINRAPLRPFVYV